MAWMWLMALLGQQARAQAGQADREEAELVARCRTGDREALARLFDAYYPRVRRMMIRLLGNHPELDDAIQNAMLEMYRGLPSFRGEAQLSTWTYRVALNVANQHLRRALRHPLPVALSEDHGAEDRRSALANLEWKEDVERLWEVVRAMPKAKRDVFVLAELEGLSAAQIAETLGISPSAAYTRLHHARRLFWEKIRRQGHFPPDAGHKED